MSEIGNRLRAAREHKNLKQTQVKEKTGIHNKTLSGYENGVSEPDLETINTLAELYDVSVDMLVSGVDKKDLDKIVLDTNIFMGSYAQRAGRVGRIGSLGGVDLLDILNNEENIYFEGKKITEDQVNMLKKFISSVILG